MQNSDILAVGCGLNECFPRARWIFELRRFRSLIERVSGNLRTNGPDCYTGSRLARVDSYDRSDAEDRRAQMTSSNTPNPPEENPLEFRAGSDPDVSHRGSSGVAKNEDESSFNPYAFHVTAESSLNQGGATQASWNDDIDHQVPPVDGSYWVIIGLLGLFSLTICFASASFWSPSLFWGLTEFAGWALMVLIPLSLLRLGLHRRSIAKAILMQTYPGGQRFGLWYLFYSLVFSGVCVLGGIVAFFGLCLGISVTIGPNGYFPGMLLLSVSGVLALAVSIFLLILGIPKYR